VGMAKNTLNLIECGGTQDPRISHIVAIARELGTTPNALLGFEEPAPRPRMARAQKQDATAPPPTKRQRPRKAAPAA
jgi:transcriptional regulator with XRE-family HTH domain